MTDYEKLSLQLLSLIAQGIAIAMIEDRAVRTQTSLEWGRLAAEVTENTREAMSRKSQNGNA